MWRWTAAILFLLAGAATTTYGVLVELQVRTDVGSGLRRWIANRFYASDIAAWRYTSEVCVILGPALIVLAYLLMRGWGRPRPSGAAAAVAPETVVTELPATPTAADRRVRSGPRRG